MSYLPRRAVVVERRRMLEPSLHQEARRDLEWMGEI
jgi:hypothetical protein